MTTASPASRPVRLALFAGWLALAAFFATHHVVWRDEMRALSLALSGDGPGGFFRAIHGDGHPALWYLILRGLYGLFPTNTVMPVAAFAIAAAATLLFALRAPFGTGMTALVLASGFAAYEYPAVARNYGIAMLLLFALADAYPRWRDRGWPIGLLLLALCNTDFHAVVLAAMLLLFWAIELVCEHGLRWHPAWRAWLAAVALAGVGALLALVVIYPPTNDAAKTIWPDDAGWLFPIEAMLSPGIPFTHLAPAIGGPRGALVFQPIVTILMLGSLLAFIRRPAALIAAYGAMLIFAAFFVFVYYGSYRHEALMLVFLIVLRWLAVQGCGGRWRVGETALAGRLERLGDIAFVLLLGLQLLITAHHLFDILRGVPESRSRDVAVLLARPELRGAVVIGDPDYNLEALPYYIDNPLYLVREHRWSHVFALSTRAEAVMDLGKLLRAGRAIQHATGRQVVILLADRLQPGLPLYRSERGSYGPLIVRPAERAAFLAATRRIARFGPAETDETYDVYLLTAR